jgi:hypothetical protein
VKKMSFSFFFRKTERENTGETKNDVSHGEDCSTKQKQCDEKIFL